MNVFLRPTGLFSPAMLRVERALAARAPVGVTIVEQPHEADVVVHHVIAAGQPIRSGDVVIQYCLKTAAGTRNLTDWIPVWSKARLVWSYYNLPALVGYKGFHFLHSPLGVEGFRPVPCSTRAGVLTFGHVSGPGAEAIWEVAIAAEIAGIRHLHIGPSVVEGMAQYPRAWKAMQNVSDEQLQYLYSMTHWVSGLRHVEGFEMPAAEGLLCGARPILFDRTDMTQWYEGHGVFVREESGQPLIDQLVELFRYGPTPVEEDEQLALRERFSWDVIARQFWEGVLA